MAEFYNGNNRKMMTHDSFSTSHKDISYMEKLPAIPNSVSYVSETKPKINAVGRKQYDSCTSLQSRPLSVVEGKGNEMHCNAASANAQPAKALSIINCALLIVFCFFFGGKAWGQQRNFWAMLNFNCNAYDAYIQYKHKKNGRGAHH